MGNVVNIFNDGDLSVYKHNTDIEGTEQEIATNYSPDNTSAGGEKMGETEYWDEFGIEGTPIPGARIYYGTSWNFYLERLNNEANSLTLAKVAYKSLPRKKYDLKRQQIYFASSGDGTGRRLRGKYATVRSAGNFLAGMNGATGTFRGESISLEMYMRLAGGLHFVTNEFSTPLSSPYYGEIPYAGRMIISGFNYGKYKVTSKNWLAYFSPLFKFSSLK